MARIDFPAFDIRAHGGFRQRWGMAGVDDRQRHFLAVDAGAAAAMRERSGFIGEDEADRLAAVLPDLVVLVRCGCGRALVYVDTLRAFVAAVEAAGDYVRDVSIYSPAEPTRVQA